MLRSALSVPFRLRTLLATHHKSPHRPLSTPVSHRENVLSADLANNAAIHPAVRAALSLENASRSELNRVKVARCVEDFRRDVSDTGSPEVQVAVMTERIKSLTEHLKAHRKDKNTERSVVKLVSNRRKMMRYLLRKSPGMFCVSDFCGGAVVRSWPRSSCLELV